MLKKKKKVTIITENVIVTMNGLVEKALPPRNSNGLLKDVK